MLVAEKFIRSLVDKYVKHTVYTDGGTWVLGGMQHNWIETLFAFSFRKKPDGKSQSVFQR